MTDRASESGVPWDRLWLVANAFAVLALAAFWLDRGLIHPHLASDGSAYWGIKDGVLYERPWLAELDGGSHPYVYSPAFAQLLWPFVQLPLPLFMALLVAVQTAIVAWLAGPALAAVLVWTFYPLWATNLWAGAIYPLMAGALALAPKHAGAWSLIVLTKVTPAIGVLWHLGRRDWRGIVIAGGVTFVIIGVSFAMSPADWFGWVGILADGASREPGPGAIPIPLAIRLPVAAVLALACGWKNAQYVLPLAVMLAVPQLGWSATPLLLASVYWWRLDRRSLGSGRYPVRVNAHHEGS